MIEPSVELGHHLDELPRGLGVPAVTLGYLRISGIQFGQFTELPMQTVEAIIDRGETLVDDRAAGVFVVPVVMVRTGTLPDRGPDFRELAHLPRQAIEAVLDLGKSSIHHRSAAVLDRCQGQTLGQLLGATDRVVPGRTIVLLGAGGNRRYGNATRGLPDGRRGAVVDNRN